MIRRLVGLLIVALLAYPAIVVALTFAYVAVPPISTLMVGRWLTGRDAERSYVPLTRIATALPATAIASEDARFCQHGGVDWTALKDVLDEADEGGPSRGASTITMQVAKNLFLWPSRSYLRKGMEIPLAMLLDAVWSKKRTMEIYLNIAEWGEGIFGAEAAARRYFGKAAAELSRREAALLVGALPNPLKRNPAKPTRGLSGRAATIMARVADTPTGCVK